MLKNPAKMRGASGPRRRPRQGGYARGDETRAQIVATALRVFAERGYDQASTRKIAAEAGVNPPAIQYYFGGKEGLHRACAEFIIERSSVWLTPARLRADKAIQSGKKRAASDALYHLIDAVTETYSHPDAASLTRFMVRVRTDGAGPAMEVVRERLGYPVFEAMAGLIGIITGLGARHETTRLRTLLILGQVYWLHANGDQTMKVMNWTSLDGDRVATLKSLLREHTRGALGDVAGLRRPAMPRRRAK